MNGVSLENVDEKAVHIPIDKLTLEGNLALSPDVSGVVIFAHGSGSGRFSPRNRFVAQELQRAGLGTLLMDLLTADEEALDERTRELRFDIEMLGKRVVGVIDWLQEYPDTRGLPIGCFGASTGAAAALVAAAERPDAVQAVVSRGGRPDLAAMLLRRVKAPTLLIVGGRDVQVVGMNQEALELLKCERELIVVPGATHLFEEPGKLEEVSRLATKWFTQHLEQQAQRAAA
jgi:putative phosphoribosyl transferase